MKKLITTLATAAALLVGGNVSADTRPNQMATPTDPQIVEILTAANNSEIAAAKLADKSQNDGVRTFAQNMIDAHSKSNTEINQLATSLNLKLQDSSISENLKKSSSQDLTKLGQLDGNQFDKAYVDGQVKAHRMVLKKLDETLIPNAKNPQLKSLLVQTRGVVQAHLEHAEKMQTSLK